ncbi:NADH-quinone oxidoreductase subunit NuoK [Nonomuraea sp. H19]|uniref:NADH-quinone oxidoreductase subunit NuoK n=1 Tax=Nonomuraea sp. H19 TaxID=3452206 RepID=UPI003F8BB623
MHIVYPAVVSALLFSVGVYGVLARRNTILVLMSVELMLNAVNLNLVAFDVWLADRLHSGQVLTLFIIVIAAAEVGLGLAIVLALYRNRRTVDIDHLRDLAEPTDEQPGARTTHSPAAPARVHADVAGGTSGPAPAPADGPAPTPADGPTPTPAGKDAEHRSDQAEPDGDREGEQPAKRGGTL